MEEVVEPIVEHTVSQIALLSQGWWGGWTTKGNVKRGEPEYPTKWLFVEKIVNHIVVHDTKEQAEHYAYTYNLSNNLVVNMVRQVDSNTLEMQLGHGKVTLIDVELHPEIEKYRWYYNKQSDHVYSNVKGKRILLHRLVLPPQHSDTRIVHLSGDNLDNRRCNLVEKGLQTTINPDYVGQVGDPYRGITPLKRRGKTIGWRVRGYAGGKQTSKCFTFSTYGHDPDVTYAKAVEYRQSYELSKMLCIIK